MSGLCFRGTTSEQDPRWGDSEKKLLDKLTKAGTFPPEYDVKVFSLLYIYPPAKRAFYLIIVSARQIDTTKCQMPIVNKWISECLIGLLGFEDDIVINLAINLLTEPVKM